MGFSEILAKPYLGEKKRIGSVQDGQQYVKMSNRPLDQFISYNSNYNCDTFYMWKKIAIYKACKQPNSRMFQNGK